MATNWMSLMIKLLEFEKATVNIHWTPWSRCRVFKWYPRYLCELVMQSEALPLNLFLAPSRTACSTHVYAVSGFSLSCDCLIAQSASVQKHWTLVRMNDLHVRLMFCLVLTTIPQSRNACALWFYHLHVWVCAVVILQRANCHRWSEWDVQRVERGISINFLMDWEKRFLSH